jgi:hypothetical protein
VIVIGVDPGPVESAYVLWDGSKILSAGNVLNAEIDTYAARWCIQRHQCWIETMQSYGTTMGRSTIDTLIWIGRFIEIFRNCGVMPRLQVRPTIKTHICGSPKANDGHVIEALTDRIGPKGSKRQPGPTYGISNHTWQALAIAVYGWDDYNFSSKLVGKKEIA